MVQVPKPKLELPALPPLPGHPEPPPRLSSPQSASVLLPPHPSSPQRQPVQTSGAMDTVPYLAKGTLQVWLSILRWEGCLGGPGRSP